MCMQLGILSLFTFIYLFIFFENQNKGEQHGDFPHFTS